MTTVVAVLLALAVVAAVVNWWSRASGSKRVEYVTKPAVTSLVALAAVATEAPGAMRWWFVAGFVLCLAGDVALMLPRERFVAGLGAFLLGHLAFVAGFVAGGLDQPWLAAVALVVVSIALAVVGRRVVAGARRTDPALGGPVTAYLLIIGSMAVVGAWHGDPWGIAGALAFVVSDALLGWNKFVQPFRSAAVAVMVTYHAALFGLLLTLV
jgi:uncharacterized membrane protein YhhN